MAQLRVADQNVITQIRATHAPRERHAEHPRGVRGFELIDQGGPRAQREFRKLCHGA